ncbi:hypothetical protein QBC45DRAFT_422146, partial [Copromyces sp. CBS 386.78]
KAQHILFSLVGLATSCKSSLMSACHINVSSFKDQMQLLCCNGGHAKKATRGFTSGSVCFDIKASSLASSQAPYKDTRGVRVLTRAPTQV